MAGRIHPGMKRNEASAETCRERRGADEAPITSRAALMYSAGVYDSGLPVHFVAVVLLFSAIAVWWAAPYSSALYFSGSFRRRRHLETCCCLMPVQGIAIVPLLALVPLFAEAGPISDEPDWIEALKVLGLLAALIGGGRFLLRPLLRMIVAPFCPRWVNMDPHARCCVSHGGAHPSTRGSLLWNRSDRRRHRAGGLPTGDHADSAVHGGDAVVRRLGRETDGAEGNVRRLARRGGRRSRPGAGPPGADRGRTAGQGHGAVLHDFRHDEYAVLKAAVVQRGWKSARSFCALPRDFAPWNQHVSVGDDRSDEEQQQG